MPKPNLTKIPVLSDDQKRSTQSAKDILAEIDKQAQDLGLVEYPKPRSSPVSLADLDLETLSNSGLGNLYAQYTAHAQWVYGQVARAEIGYKIGVSNLKQIEAQMKAKLFSQNIAKAEVPALVREDALRISYEIEVLKLYATKEILEAYYKAYSKQAEALSRIISLRELDFDMTTRDMGIQGRKGAGYQKGRPPGDLRRG